MGGDRPTRSGTGNAPVESPQAVARYTRRRKRTSNARYPVAKGRFPFWRTGPSRSRQEGFRNGEYVKRDRWFESISLQRRVMQTGSSRLIIAADLDGRIERKLKVLCPPQRRRPASQPCRPSQTGI